MLTRKQYELLRFISERLKESGVPPSFDEMKDALDLRSKSGIHRLITALEERGFEDITAENVYYGRSERMAGYKFYTAVRAAMANSLAFSVALWRDNEVIARAKL